MDLDPTLLSLLPLAVMAAFGFGWLAARFDLRQWRREQADSPKAYYRGLNLLLNEQQDKAIDAFIEAMRQDPGTADLHFALGNLFRRRGEYERAVRVHEHLLARSDLAESERARAQFALAQDFLKAGLFDRAEAAFLALDGSAFATDARLELLSLYERSRDWHAAIETARKLEASGAGSFAIRIAHHWSELAQEADARQRPEDARAALDRAREAAPQAPRPQVLLGLAHARAGQPAEALAAWQPLIASQPSIAALVASEIARAAQAAGQVEPVCSRLVEAHRLAPSQDLLNAILLLTPETEQQSALLDEALASRPTLSCAGALMRHQVAQGAGLSPAQTEALARVVASGARPQQRYRCAACGFEAQNYFWQCPGCQTWDSYPPQRLEDA